MQTETALLAPACACRPSILNRVGRNRMLLGGVALTLLAAGFVWQQWSWLVAIGVAPLLISAAPCLGMCALGMCMHRRPHRQHDSGRANSSFDFGKPFNATGELA